MKRFLLLSILIAFGASSLFGVNASWNYTTTTAASSPISMTGATTLGGGGDDVGYSLAWPLEAILCYMTLLFLHLDSWQ